LVFLLLPACHEHKDAPKSDLESKLEPAAIVEAEAMRAIFKQFKIASPNQIRGVTVRGFQPTRTFLVEGILDLPSDFGMKPYDFGVAVTYEAGQASAYWWHVGDITFPEPRTRFERRQ